MQTGHIQTLKRLLDHGLLVKQKQAKLALSLNAANHKKVREAMIQLNGWKNRYIRLDEEGVRRTKELESLQRKMRKTSCTKEQELLQRYDSGLARRACFSEVGIQVPLDA